MLTEEIRLHKLIELKAEKLSTINVSVPIKKQLALLRCFDSLESSQSLALKSTHNHELAGINMQTIEALGIKTDNMHDVMKRLLAQLSKMHDLIKLLKNIYAAQLSVNSPEGIKKLQEDEENATNRLVQLIADEGKLYLEFRQQFRRISDIEKLPAFQSMKQKIESGRNSILGLLQGRVRFVRLRGHHISWIFWFKQGKLIVTDEDMRFFPIKYSPEFARNNKLLDSRIDNDTLVEIVSGNDDVCDMCKCPYRELCRARNYEVTIQTMISRLPKDTPKRILDELQVSDFDVKDRRFLGYLDLHVGDVVRFGDIKGRLD